MHLYNAFLACTAAFSVAVASPVKESIKEDFLSLIKFDEFRVGHKSNISVPATSCPNTCTLKTDNKNIDLLKTNHVGDKIVFTISATSSGYEHVHIYNGKNRLYNETVLVLPSFLAERNVVAPAPTRQVSCYPGDTFTVTAAAGVQVNYNKLFVELLRVVGKAQRVYTFRAILAGGTLIEIGGAKPRKVNVTIRLLQAPTQLTNWPWSSGHPSSTTRHSSSPVSHASSKSTTHLSGSVKPTAVSTKHSSSAIKPIATSTRRSSAVKPISSATWRTSSTGNPIVAPTFQTSSVAKPTAGHTWHPSSLLNPISSATWQIPSVANPSVWNTWQTPSAVNPASSAIWGVPSVTNPSAWNTWQTSSAVSAVSSAISGALSAASPVVSSAISSASSAAGPIVSPTFQTSVLTLPSSPTLGTPLSTIRPTQTTASPQTTQTLSVTNGLQFSINAPTGQRILGYNPLITYPVSQVLNNNGTTTWTFATLNVGAQTLYTADGSLKCIVNIVLAKVGGLLGGIGGLLSGAQSSQVLNVPQGGTFTISALLSSVKADTVPSYDSHYCKLINTSVNGNLCIYTFTALSVGGPSTISLKNIDGATTSWHVNVGLL